MIRLLIAVATVVGIFAGLLLVVAFTVDFPLALPICLVLWYLILRKPIKMIRASLRPVMIATTREQAGHGRRRTTCRAQAVTPPLSTMTNSARENRDNGDDWIEDEAD